MPLDRLAEQIQSQSRKQLADEQARLEAETQRIAADRDARVTKVRDDILRQADVEATRERAQRIAGAKMQAKKLEYEAEERALALSLDSVRQHLAGFTASDDYALLLKRMYQVAVDRFGKDVKITGRAEDAARLKSIAGKGFQATPAPILGGLIAETSDGSRRLVLSFDELLRYREAAVRDLLSR
jgi:vacuolar-type H+-ATPase subunit E/Vma4